MLGSSNRLSVRSYLIGNTGYADWELGYCYWLIYPKNAGLFSLIFFECLDVEFKQVIQTTIEHSVTSA